MKEKIFLIGIIFLVICVIILTDTSDSILGKFFENFLKPDWSQVKERNIVKNSFPITLLEKSEGECTIDAKNFKHIIDHTYFKRSAELAKELHYDKENKTIQIPCHMIPEKKSRFQVWYATEEAINHSTKYEYFVTPIENKN